MEEENKPNYYAIIPAYVRYDNELPDKAKLLYGEISALANKTGECWAGNKYFSDLYEISTEHISRLINKLKEKGYISIELIYKDNSKQIEKRIIKLKSASNKEISIPIDKNINTPIDKNINTPIDKNIKDNNTSMNNTSMNNIYNMCVGETKNTHKFIIPSLEEIKSYCEERNNGIDAEYFMDFYSSKGWMVGKNKMKDWRAAVRTWEKGNKKVAPAAEKNEPEEIWSINDYMNKKGF